MNKLLLNVRKFVNKNEVKLENSNIDLKRLSDLEEEIRELSSKVHMDAFIDDFAENAEMLSNKLKEYKNKCKEYIHIGREIFLLTQEPLYFKCKGEYSPNIKKDYIWSTLKQSCVTGCTRMYLNDNGEDIQSSDLTEKKIALTLDTNQKTGTKLDKAQDFLRQYGIETALFTDLKMEELEFAANCPGRSMAIWVTLGRRNEQVSHEVMVDQIDKEENGFVHIRDPREGTYSVTKAEFRKFFLEQCLTEANIGEEVHDCVQQRMNQVVFASEYFEDDGQLSNPRITDDIKLKNEKEKVTDIKEVFIEYTKLIRQKKDSDIASHDKSEYEGISDVEKQLLTEHQQRYQEVWESYLQQMREIDKKKFNQEKRLEADIKSIIETIDMDSLAKIGMEITDAKQRPNFPESTYNLLKNQMDVRNETKEKIDLAQNIIDKEAIQNSMRNTYDKAIKLLDEELAKYHRYFESQRKFQQKLHDIDIQRLATELEYKRNSIIFYANINFKHLGE